MDGPGGGRNETAGPEGVWSVEVGWGLELTTTSRRMRDWVGGGGGWCLTYVPWGKQTLCLFPARA